jgi:hypothetical protein
MKIQAIQKAFSDDASEKDALGAGHRFGTPEAAASRCDGRLMPVITGQESDVVLRDLAIHFAEESSAHSGNPFQVLSSHYRGSLKTLVQGMTRAALLSLFELEEQLRQNRVRAGAASELMPTH